MHPSLTAPVAVTLALPLLSAAQGRGAMAGINASSHWLLPDAGRDGFDLRETGVGLATNIAAAAMWGSVMALVLRRTGAPAVSAVGVSAGAAMIDYALLPRRLSPGWERVMPPSGVAAAFLALAVGMMLGKVEAD